MYLYSDNLNFVSAGLSCTIASVAETHLQLSRLCMLVIAPKLEVLECPAIYPGFAQCAYGNVQRPVHAVKTWLRQALAACNCEYAICVQAEVVSKENKVSTLIIVKRYSKQSQTSASSAQLSRSSGTILLMPIWAR